MLETNLEPDSRQLRAFGALAAVVLGAFATWTHFRGRGALGPHVPGIIAGLLLLGAVAARRLAPADAPADAVRRLRVTALLAAILFAALCAGLTAAGRGVTPVLLGAIAALLAIACVTAPDALRPVYHAAIGATLPLGFVLGHVAMATIYFGVFTPVALVFRLIGRDVLRRRFDPEADTYWIPRRPTPDAKRYFRQF